MYIKEQIRNMLDNPIHKRSKPSTPTTPSLSTFWKGQCVDNSRLDPKFESRLRFWTYKLIKRVDRGTELT